MSSLDGNVSNYNENSQNYCIIMGPKSMALLREVGRRVAAETGEPRSTDYLLQRLSVAVQRGNCASVHVLGSIAT